MSRKTRTESREESPPETLEAEDVDLHGFWDRAKLDGDENDEAFAIVIDAGVDLADGGDDFAGMGNVTQIDPEELKVLAEWAEAKACRSCRRRIGDHHDPALLRHDECCSALRVGRLLRRYQ